MGLFTVKVRARGGLSFETRVRAADEAEAAERGVRKLYGPRARWEADASSPYGRVVATLSERERRKRASGAYRAADVLAGGVRVEVES
jgi:hypothetical protein